MAMYRCPTCRTRRKDHGLFLAHLEQSGHLVCRCSSYAYPHRAGSPLCNSIFSVTPDAMAKQTEDAQTLELPGLELGGMVLPAKRGRGRPRVENPLTPAERAKAYRERKAARNKRAANMPPVLYRGPWGESWTGRGLMPKWLQVLIRDGQSKEAFRVKA